MTELTDDEIRLWRAWKGATEVVRRRVADDIAAATGLSDPDFDVLSRLIHLGEGTLRQNELAASMDWHRSRLSHQLSRMEQRGQVVRSSAGGGVAVTITDAGRAAIDAARPVHTEAVRKHLSGLVPDGQTDAFVDALERIAGGA
jgi:DNA-binding MarR family transcriptional regulator